MTKYIYTGNIYNNHGELVAVGYESHSKKMLEECLWAAIRKHDPNPKPDHTYWDYYKITKRKEVK